MLPLLGIGALFELLPPITSVLQDNYASVLPLIAIAFAISTGITALMYMLGNALQSQDILGMAKDNLTNLIFSAIVVLMFFSFFFLFYQISTSIACTHPCDPVDAAYQSVLLLRAKISSLYTQLYFYEIIFGFLSTLGFSIPIPAISPATLATFLISMPSISLSPLAGLSPLSNAHTIVVEAVGSVFLMVLARQVLLEFIGRYIFLFFILGLCLRAFTFTKKTGASILALATVAYFVYPLAVLSTNYMIFQVYKPTNFGVVPTAIGYCKDPATVTDIATKFSTERGALYSADYQKTESRWYMFWEFFKSAATFVKDTMWSLVRVLFTFDLKQLSIIISPMAFSTFFDFLIVEIQVLVQFVVVVIVSFFLEIVITITAYRGLAQFMEGETEIFGINKLI